AGHSARSGGPAGGDSESAAAAAAAAAGDAAARDAAGWAAPAAARSGHGGTADRGSRPAAAGGRCDPAPSDADRLRAIEVDTGDAPEVQSSELGRVPRQVRVSRQEAGGPVRDRDPVARDVDGAGLRAADAA